MKTITQSAECAKAIRKELKEQFPQTKFSVRAKNFSGGNDVRISWNFGPISKAVKSIVEKYQYGHFDGMIDLYEYKPNFTGPGVKYILTSRHFNKPDYLAIPEKNWQVRSDYWNQEKSFHHDLMRDIAKVMGITYQGQYTKIYPNGHETLNDAVHKLTSVTDFTDKTYVGVRLKANAPLTGNLTDFYEIYFKEVKL